MWRIKSLIYSITNLFYYLPIIWKDRQWDYYYIEQLLLYKYKRHYKANMKSLAFENSDIYMKALKICITILERRRDDWYSKTFHYLILDTYDIMDSESEFTVNEEIYDLKSNNAESVYNRDWKIYCNIVNKYQDHWWD